MRNAIKTLFINTKRGIKRSAASFLFIIPVLLLKIRAGISFQESKTIARFYLSSALHCKQYLMALKVFFLLFFKISWKEFFPDYSLFSEKQYKAKDPSRKIGQWYSIDPDTLKGTAAKADTQNTKYFSIGREPIAHILKSNHFDRKVALLPSFTCFTVLDPFLQNGWKIEFYRYHYDLTIDRDHFLEVFEKTDPSLCIFQPLSGMGFLDLESSLIDYAHNHGCMTVIDQTQDIYNDRNHPSVDYYCGSLRKWYPFPDGAFLYSEKYPITECEGLEENRVYRTSMGLCMFAAHLSSTYEDPFFPYLYQFMWSFSVSYIGNTDIVSHSMSDYSRKILEQQDEKLNINRRITNFRCLYDGMAGLSNVRPAFDHIERLTGVPLSFPVYVKDRRKLTGLLSANGIVTQILWPKPPYIKENIKLDTTTEFIYAHIISLPCDQRYDLEDMTRMIDIIRNYDQSVQ